MCWPTIRTALLPFGEDWLAGSHGGGGISRQPVMGSADRAGRHLWLRRSVGIGNCRRRRCLRPYGGVYASCKPADAVVLLSITLVV